MYTALKEGGATGIVVERLDDKKQLRMEIQDTKVVIEMDGITGKYTLTFSRRELDENKVEFSYFGIVNELLQLYSNAPLSRASLIVGTREKRDTEKEYKENEKEELQIREISKMLKEQLQTYKEILEELKEVERLIDQLSCKDRSGRSSYRSSRDRYYTEEQRERMRRISYEEACARMVKYGPYPPNLSDWWIYDPNRPIVGLG